MSSALITLVTICRNAETTIAHTIESVRDQCFSPLEYIVIDGASTDSTPNIARSFEDIVDVFVSEPDAGIADAFNKGIARASGDIIGFINADDQLLPGALDMVAKYFASCPDADVMHGDVLLYSGNKFLKRVAPARYWWYPWRLVLFNHPATFVRRDLYLRCGLFDASFHYAMDDELYLRWERSGANIRYLSEPVVRMQSGGASGRNTSRVFMEKRRALLKHGYSRFLVEVQFLSRFGVQIVAVMQSLCRKCCSSAI